MKKIKKKNRQTDKWCQIVDMRNQNANGKFKHVVH